MLYSLSKLWPCKNSCQPIFPKMQGTYSFVPHWQLSGFCSFVLLLMWPLLPFNETGRKNTFCKNFQIMRGNIGKLRKQLFNIYVYSFCIFFSFFSSILWAIFCSWYFLSFFFLTFRMFFFGFFCRFFNDFSRFFNFLRSFEFSFFFFDS